MKEELIRAAIAIVIFTALYVALGIAAYSHREHQKRKYLRAKRERELNRLIREVEMRAKGGF
jgi:hypothetical protein